jgi:hypothetical protein
VLAVTNMYPTAHDPAYGAFVATEVKSLLHAGAAVHVDFITDAAATPRISPRRSASAAWPGPGGST